MNEEIKVEEVSPKIEEEKRVESIEEKDIKEEHKNIEEHLQMLRDL